MKIRTFVIGVKGLDKLFGEIIPPYTILIAGHPGSGKTTFASTICYSNTLKGLRCLYASVYEEKDKLFDVLEHLGLNLRESEEKGLLKFLRLPLTLNIEKTIDTISKIVLEEKFDVVVVDSITALIESSRLDFEKRAWLLNYFYQLPSIIDGLLVLVGELPLGRESLDPGSVEFISDATFVLKHTIEDGFIVRLMEMRKARGKPLNIAEVPFDIVENRGIIVYTPPILEELPRQREEIFLPCQCIRDKVEHIHKDFLVNIFYPPETIYGREPLVLFLALSVIHKFKVLIISYISSPLVLREVIKTFLLSHGLSIEKVEKLLDEYVVIRGLNPYAQSLPQLIAKELELIEMYEPDIVIFHGVHVVKYDPVKRFKELYNQVLYLKSKGIGVVRIGDCDNEQRCAEEASISDLTLWIERITTAKGLDYKVKVCRRFREPVVITSEEMKLCYREAVDYIEKSLS